MSVSRRQVNFVGRSKVFLPYYFYKEPMQDYPVSVPAGDNLSFPRKGACTETQNLGDAGCTWKRLPTSRMLYVPATQYSVLLRLNGGGGRENGDFAFFSLLTTAHVLSMHPTLTSGVRTPLTSQVWLRPARRRVEHHGVPASHREEIGHTMKNIDSFNKARDGLDFFRTPRCCGC